MKKTAYFLASLAVLFVATFTFYKLTAPKPMLSDVVADEPEEKDGYDGPAQRDRFELEKIKDPSLGFVPVDRMMRAVEFTKASQRSVLQRQHSAQAALNWVERGPIYDSIGPSGNDRGGNSYTAGRITGVLIDYLNDPTGNTVFAGGVAGGLWRCTNFLSPFPNWQHIDDRFDNMAVASICQNPASPQTLYFSTGEATSNADAVYGGGIWKSVNGGSTWMRLPSSLGFQRSFHMVCDAAGNIYAANRSSGLNGSQPSGLFRSKDGGATWQNITPNPLTSSNSICTDIEISSTGRLHASFGYTGSRVQHLHTPDPANVSASTWTASTGLRMSTTSAYRLELAAQGDILYGVTVNTSSQLDSCYKSIDGGDTWTKQNTSGFATGILNGQGWYNLTLAINPENSDEFIVGGLDAYKSSNGGITIPTKITNWIGAPYVHADHHFIQWDKVGPESRVVIGGDGGMFYSTNGGSTWSDRNKNLAIKQFYSGAIHPDAGSNYMLAGAQDNGVHQFTNPGLSYSKEVYGGDGCFVHINQQNPQIQFGSYIDNTYRISTNGGATWSSRTISNNGYFVNPFDYDDAQNSMYASNAGSTGNNQILRWENAHANGAVTTLTINALTRSSAANASAFKVSPYTRDRVFIGASNGKLVRLDDANTVTAATVNANVTDISGTSLPAAFVSSINVGSSDNDLVATFSSYGVGHVWVSSNGGTSWTAIDGNLPDMPVRWALFDPQSNTKMYLATEAGVYYTDAINGAATVWTADPNFPAVRTDMLKLRLSDNTVVAATHGRGLYTAQLPSTPEVRFQSPFAVFTEANSGAIGCQGYKDYTLNIAITGAPTGDATVTYAIEAGNTATEGRDFDFTTNGNFASISRQHTFSNGSSASKTLMIRIYDDAEVEALESFRIKYSIAGATNATAGPYNGHEITIKDNDVMPAPPAAGTATIGIGDYGGYIQPFRGSFQKAKSQYIYLASELTAAGFTAGNMNSLALNVLSKSSTNAFEGLTIALKNTTSEAFTSVDFESGAVAHFSARYNTVIGINTFNFTSPFVWDGSSNILVEICYDNNAIPGGSGDNVSSNITQDIKGIWNRATLGAGCSLPGAFAGVGPPTVYMRPDIILNGNLVNNAVETTLNATTSSLLGTTNGVVNFYTTSGKVIASIKTLGSHDYGCTQVKIDRAGTSSVAFTNNTPANFLMSKTLQVVPTINTANGQYQITLYYTAAEKAGWETATGQQWSNIKIIKVKSQISNYSAANPTPDGAAPVETVTPIFGTYGSDYTLTYIFNSGFSGYGAGILTGCAAATITTQPTAQTVCTGSSANLSVVAGGTGPFTYQWRKGGSAIPGAVTATYTIANVAAGDAANYDVVVTGACGSAVSSSVAALTVSTATAITAQPAPQTICAGANAVFSVTASGTNLTYQWRKDGNPISGATGASYTVSNAVIANAGNYTVTVTGACGALATAGAVLTVNTSGGCVTAVSNLNADITSVSLLPNRFQQQTTIRVKAARAMNIDWNVTDGQGRVVMRFRQAVTQGMNNYTLSATGLAAGSYYLTGQTSKGSTGILRFIKL